MAETLLFEEANGLCTLTLNRPEKHNALDTDVFEKIDAACARLEANADRVGCVVLKANGKSFCAGADLVALADRASLPPPTFKPHVIERLSRVPQIVIAQIHGLCVTGGLELALAADLIVASQSARFADTHGKWGLVAGWGMTQRLPRRVGPSAAKLMMLTGRFASAEEALRLGLVDVCVADDRLEQEVADLVRDVLANSWHTNRENKRVLRETDGMSLAEGLAHEHYRHPGLAADFRDRVERFKKT